MRPGLHAVMQASLAKTDREFATAKHVRPRTFRHVGGDVLNTYNQPMTDDDVLAMIGILGRWALRAEITNRDMARTFAQDALDLHAAWVAAKRFRRCA